MVLHNNSYGGTLEFTDAQMERTFTFDEILRVLDKYWLDIEKQAREAGMPNHEIFVLRQKAAANIREKFVDMMHNKAVSKW